MKFTTGTNQINDTVFTVKRVKDENLVLNYFEIYNKGATEVKAVVSEENIYKYNVDVQDPFSVGLIMPMQKSEFSVTRSNGTVTAKFDVTIIFDENGHVDYFELKRDGGVISKGRNMLKSGKFVALCEQLGITIDVYFKNFEDLKKGLA